MTNKTHDAEIRIAYQNMAVMEFRDVFLPAISDPKAQALASKITDEQIRTEAGKAYDKMMGLGQEKITIHGDPLDPNDGPRSMTAVLAMDPAGGPTVTERGPDIGRSGAYYKPGTNERIVMAGEEIQVNVGAASKMVRGHSLG